MKHIIDISLIPASSGFSHMFVKVLKYSEKEQRCSFTEYLICFSASNVQIRNFARGYCSGTAACMQRI